MDLPFCSSSPLAVRILRAMRQKGMLDEVMAGKGRGGYYARVWRSLSAMDVVAQELRHHIDALASHDDITAAMISVKAYIVTWCTLTDLVASFINNALDLGLDHKDIKFTTVMRDAHVRNSGVPDIVKDYQAKVQHDRFSKLRNAIVHRGRLDDTTLLTLGYRLQEIYFLRMLDQDVSEEREQIRSELATYLPKKQAEFDKHLGNTLMMISDLVEYVHQQLAQLEAKARCWPL